MGSMLAAAQLIRASSTRDWLAVGLLSLSSCVSQQKEACLCPVDWPADLKLPVWLCAQGRVYLTELLA
jgi:hypothetical protein